MVKKIVCSGYGGYHGETKGRKWFVCSACRWSSGVSNNAGRSSDEILARQIAALNFAIANENEPMNPDDHG